MRVKANTLCFVGGARRRPGQVFEVADGFQSQYCDPVEGGKSVKVEKPKVEKKPAKEPETLSELTKAMPKGADLI